MNTISNDLDLLSPQLALILVIVGLMIAIVNVFSKDIEFSENYILRRIVKILPYGFFVFASIILYLDAGNSLSVSIFNGICSFFRVKISYNSTIYIEAMNTFVTIVLINALVPSLSNFIKMIIFFIIEKVFNKEIYILHGDNSTVKMIRRNFEDEHNLVIEVNSKNEKFYHHFNNHIIAYDSEDKNMKMAVLINNINDKSNLYVLSSSCDSTLFMRNTINIVDKNDLAVKQFWKSYGGEIYNKLNDKSFKNCRISIVGTNEIAYNMYLYVLKNCIYRLDQSININVLTNFFNMEYFKLANETIKDKMTNDTVTIDLIKYSNVFNMQESDIVIVTDKSLLSKIAVKYRYGQLVYIYDPNFNDKDYVRSDHNPESNKNIKPFGADSEILTVQNIINNEDIEYAKKVNYGYMKAKKDNEKVKEIMEDNINYPEEEDKINAIWDRIENNVIYNINSNYCVADYRRIREYIEEDEKDEKVREQIEHIRWSRVVYLEGFRYYKEYTKDEKLVEKIDEYLVRKEGAQPEREEVKCNMLDHKIHYDLRPLDSVKDADELKKDSDIYTYTKK